MMNTHHRDPSLDNAMRLLNAVYDLLRESAPDREARLYRERLQNERAQAEQRQALAGAIAVGRADQELYDDVVAELIAEGKAPHVAANLVNSQVKLLAEARRLSVI